MLCANGELSSLARYQGRTFVLSNAKLTSHNNGPPKLRTFLLKIFTRVYIFYGGVPFATGTNSDYDDFHDINKDNFTRNRCSVLVVPVR